MKSCSFELLIRLTAVAATIVVLGLSCSDDKTSSPSTGPGSNSISNDLIFEYPNGTEIPMGRSYSICCGIWEPGYIDKNTLKLFFYDPSFQESFWKLFIAIDEIVLDSLYSLPTSGSSVKMFLMDVDSSNELSSDESESSGNITVSLLDCGPPVSVSLTIDATVGSEYGGMPSVNVSGSFSCTIHSNPAPFGCDFSL